MILTTHFTLEEMVHSETAVRLGIDNEPDSDVISNLRTLCVYLERVRDLLGYPITISSGYRSLALNSALKGSPTSAHCRGLAADFICPRFGEPKDCAKMIAESTVKFDQLIYEGTWVHFGIASDGMRGQILTAHFGNGPVTYSQGIA